MQLTFDLVQYLFETVVNAIHVAHSVLSGRCAILVCRSNVFFHLCHARSDLLVKDEQRVRVLLLRIAAEDGNGNRESSRFILLLCAIF